VTAQPIAVEPLTEGLSNVTVYRLARAVELPTITIGTKQVVPSSGSKRVRMIAKSDPKEEVVAVRYLPAR
jgi:hypothetical protein